MTSGLCPHSALSCCSAWLASTAVGASDRFCIKASGHQELLLLLPQDLNHDPSNPNTRLYATHAAQPYHNDASDIVGKRLHL